MAEALFGSNSVIGAYVQWNKTVDDILVFCNCCLRGNDKK